MNLDEIEGIGSTYATTLQTHGLTTVDHLLEQAAAPPGGRRWPRSPASANG